MLLQVVLLVVPSATAGGAVVLEALGNKASRRDRLGIRASEHDVWILDRQIVIVGAFVTGCKSGTSAAVMRLLICTGPHCGAASIRKHSTLFILTCALLELSWLLFVVDGC